MATFEPRLSVGDSLHAKRDARPAGAGAASGSAAATDAGPRAAARARAAAGSDAASSCAAALTSAGTQRAQAGPREERERPLGAYAVLTALFAAGFGGPLLAAERRGTLPERVATGDLVLVAVSTFKLSRMLARDAITGFVRAPFVDYEGMESVTTPRERPRGEGLQRAVGQLLLCPGCVGAWAAASLTTALVAKPRPTRIVCSALTAIAASDFLQAGYARVKAS